MNSYLGTVWKYLPKTHAVRKQAALVESLVKHPLSNFDVDAASSIYAFKAAMEKGGFSREAINTALETKVYGTCDPRRLAEAVEAEPHRPAAREHVGGHDRELQAEARVGAGVHEEEEVGASRGRGCPARSPATESSTSLTRLER